LKRFWVAGLALALVAPAVPAHAFTTKLLDPSIKMDASKVEK
jgi:hypothetical protein